MEKGSGGCEATADNDVLSYKDLVDILLAMEVVLLPELLCVCTREMSSQLWLRSEARAYLPSRLLATLAASSCDIWSRWLLQKP